MHLDGGDCCMHVDDEEGGCMHVDAGDGAARMWMMMVAACMWMMMMAACIRVDDDDEYNDDGGSC